MSKRYWFYVRGAGNLNQLGKHRLCFSPIDTEATLAGLLQMVFSVKQPCFKLYVMLNEEGDVMNDPEVRALEAAEEAVAEGGTPLPQYELCSISSTAIVADLLKFAEAADGPAGQRPAAMHLYVDCDSTGASWLRNSACIDMRSNELATVTSVLLH